LIVTTAVLEHPVGGVYVIVDVPGDAPYTIPEVIGPTVAMSVLLLDHVPAPAASVNEVVAPTQALSVPLMAAGNACTVTTAVAAQVPPSE
jgi:hypothetical protein